MPELRWTLLIIGVLFVVILAWWERRRPHQASRQAPHISDDPHPVITDGWGSAEGMSVASPREPSLTLPEIHTDPRTRTETRTRADTRTSIEGRSSALTREDARTREDAPSPLPVHVERTPTSPRELPVVEIPDDSIDELRVDDDPVDVDNEHVEVDRLDEEEEESLEEVLEEEAVAIVEPPAAPAPTLPAPPAEFPRPIVEWPPEEQRTLVSLRLVARPPDRFRGNLLRQALAAEGFMLGDFDIFHKPDANNRAVLSAASLTKPGSFDLETMDTQRFTGLNLFAVLPGPKSPQKAFEDLLMAARMLNERLEGALQDDRGGPLTPMRIQALRDSLGAEARS
jgi:FtsZ-interacting cell division protein ZipA